MLHLVKLSPDVNAPVLSYALEGTPFAADHGRYNLGGSSSSHRLMVANNETCSQVTRSVLHSTTFESGA